MNAQKSLSQKRKQKTSGGGLRARFGFRKERRVLEKSKQINTQTPLRLARARRRMRIILALVLLLLVFGIVYFFGTLSQHTNTTIAHVEIVGAQSLSTSALQERIAKMLSGKYFYLYAKKNIFIYPKWYIQSTLKKDFPRIKKVDIARKDMQTLVVTIHEREPYALWCRVEVRQTVGVGNEDVLPQSSVDVCYYVDSNGFIFEEAPTFTGLVYPVFKGGVVAQKDKAVVGRHVFPGSFIDIKKIFLTLPDYNTHPVMITSDDAENIFIDTKEGFQIKARSTDGADYIIDTIDTVLSSDVVQQASGSLEYIDIRFGNRVFYRFFGADERIQ